MTELPDNTVLWRQARELEVARGLHACMYPCVPPEHPDLEIAVLTRPASEISGDYYDFRVETNGALTVAVGDATGHGLPAGMLVTATKALFLALGHEPSLTDTFERITQVLKQMRLCRHYMSLTLARFDASGLRVASAGMPFPLIFRSASGRVHPVELKGLPLGSVNGFPYREEQVDVGPGDAVLFMSDGIAERFDEAGEQFGYDRVAALLAATGTESAEAILTRIVQASDLWARCCEVEDDLTLIALKVREQNRNTEVSPRTTPPTIGC
jgi:serine phosphatase RsbU (regulator of sigma subunit)